jgi:hypothetical protein
VGIFSQSHSTNANSRSLVVRCGGLLGMKT